MGDGVIRCDVDGPTVRLFRGLPVPFEEPVDLPERDVGFGGRVVQYQRAFGVRLCRGERVVR